MVDVGSNTIHLLAAESDGVSLKALDDESTRLRLGRDVARFGEIGPEKLALALQTLTEYVDRARDLGAKTISLIGTQAVRSAANGPEFAQQVGAATGLSLTTISPAAESRLGYLGTMLDTPAERPRVIIDIGGGSTQMLLVDEKGRSRFVRSLPVGSVVLPALLIAHDPPNRAERGALLQAVSDAMEQVRLLAETGSVTPEYGVAIGGVARRLRRAGRLASGEPLLRHWVERLVPVALRVSSEAMEVFEAVRHDDADIVRTGAVIMRELMRIWSLEYCIVSDNGIREGAVLALARGEDVSSSD